MDSTTIVCLAQTSASLSADDYDATTTHQMTAGAGVLSLTSAQVLGQAVRALGARRIALVSPYSQEVRGRARQYFERARPTPMLSVPPGGNFPTMRVIAAWEQQFQKPVVTTNQAAL